MFILAQIFGFLAWLCLLISYYRKNTNKILILHILSIVFYLLNYLFLGAWSGLFIIILELVRDSLYYKTYELDIQDMTVGELIDKLSEMPEKSEVLVHYYQEGEVYGCEPELEEQNYNNRVWITPGEIKVE